MRPPRRRSARVGGSRLARHQICIAVYRSMKGGGNTCLFYEQKNEVSYFIVRGDMQLPQSIIVYWYARRRSGVDEFDSTGTHMCRRVALCDDLLINSARYKCTLSCVLQTLTS